MIVLDVLTGSSLHVVLGWLWHSISETSSVRPVESRQGIGACVRVPERCHAARRAEHFAGHSGEGEPLHQTYKDQVYAALFH